MGVLSIVGRPGIYHRSEQTVHVLLSIEEYRKLTGGMTTLADALAQQDSMDVEFEALRVDRLHRAADLS